MGECIHICSSYKESFHKNFSLLLMWCSAGEVVLKLSCILFKLFCFWVFKSILHLRALNASFYYEILSFSFFFFLYFVPYLGFHDQSLLRHFDTCDIKWLAKDFHFYGNRKCHQNMKYFHLFANVFSTKQTLCSIPITILSISLPFELLSRRCP